MGLLERLASTLAGGADLDDGAARGDRGGAGPRGRRRRQLGGGRGGAAGAGRRGARRRPRCWWRWARCACGGARTRPRSRRSGGRSICRPRWSTAGWGWARRWSAWAATSRRARPCARCWRGPSIPSAGRAAHAGRGRIALALDEPARAVRELRQAAELQPGGLTAGPRAGAGAGGGGRARGHRRLHAGWSDAARSPAADPGWVLEAAAAAPTPAAAEAHPARSRWRRRRRCRCWPTSGRRWRRRWPPSCAGQGRADEGRPLAEAAAAVGAARLRPCARRWRCATRRAGRYRRGAGGAAGGAGGRAWTPTRLVRLALGAQDREALGEAGRAAAQPPTRSTRCWSRCRRLSPGRARRGGAAAGAPGDAGGAGARRGQPPLRGRRAGPGRGAGGQPVRAAHLRPRSWPAARPSWRRCCRWRRARWRRSTGRCWWR